MNACSRHSGRDEARPSIRARGKNADRIVRCAAAGAVCFLATLWAAASIPSIPSTAGSTFIPLDLKPLANLDPLTKTDPFGLSQVPAPPPCIWVEGESRGKQEGGFGPESRAAASGGIVLGNGFGARAGDWAEWYFDVPFESAKAQLYLRVAREGHNPVATLLVTLDGNTSITYSIPQTGGPGDRDQDFDIGLARAVVRDLEMGRHVMRITVKDAGDVIALDGFWLSADVQDIINRVDEHKRLPAPAAFHMLVYPYGRNRVRGIELDLLDPALNSGKGVYLSSGVPGILPCGGAQGDRIHLLGAGVQENVEVEVEAAYEDGTQETATVTLGTLFTRKPEQPVIALGMLRYGYLSTITVQRKPLRELRLISGADPFVLVGATVEVLPPNRNAGIPAGSSHP